MTGLGMRYAQQDNCFTWIEDVDAGAAAAGGAGSTPAGPGLNRLVAENHPTLGHICRPMALSYYWTACESEYATDVMFAHPQQAGPSFTPALVHHGIKSFGSRDVLRFLGHKPPQRRG